MDAKRKKLIERLVIFFVGAPLILALSYVGFLHHLPFNLAVVGVAAFACYELAVLFGTNGETENRILLVILASLVPVAEYLTILFGQNAGILGQGGAAGNEIFGDLSGIVLVLSIFIIFASEIFSVKDFALSNARIARSICAVLYAGFLPSFIVRLSRFERPFEHIATFLVLVFISDSAAWLFGVLFGKKNRGIIAASPNKSVAGFLGAYAGNFVFALIMTYIFRETFSAEHKILRVAVLSVLTCTAAIIGDLAESVFKRSSEVKDSGNIVLGRGGILDSVDSIFMAAPFYYYLVKVLFA